VIKILKYISFLFLFISISVIVSCATFKTPILIDLENIELIGDNDSIFEIKASCALYNPNWFSLSSSDIKFQLYSDSIYLGSGYIVTNLFLNKFDTASVNTTFYFEKKQLLFLSSFSDSLELKFIGKAQIPYIKSDYFFEFNYFIDINEMISLFSESFIITDNIKIKEVNLKKVNFKNINLEVLFSMMNDFDEELIIDKLNVTVFKTDDYKKKLGSSSLKEQVIIEANKETIIKTDVNFNALSLGVSIISNSLNNTNAFYLKVESEILLDDNRIPFTILKKVNYDPLTLKITF